MDNNEELNSNQRQARKTAKDKRANETQKYEASKKFCQCVQKLWSL